MLFVASRTIAQASRATTELARLPTDEDVALEVFDGAMRAELGNALAPSPFVVYVEHVVEHIVKHATHTQIAHPLSSARQSRRLKPVQILSRMWCHLSRMWCHVVRSQLRRSEGFTEICAKGHVCGCVCRLLYRHVRGRVYRHMCRYVHRHVFRHVHGHVHEHVCRHVHGHVETCVIDCR